MNPLQHLHGYGQSVWLDYIRRNLILSGELQRLVDQDGLMGVTSNPAIFEKAISGSTDYSSSLRLLAEGSCSSKDIFEQLAIRDIQDAADVLWPVYLRTGGRDGYVSLEVSPYLAADTNGTLEEARRLHKLVGRENVMIKVPATPGGIPAFQQLIASGINVNVTLLFSQKSYEEVAKAYIAGLEELAAQGKDISKVASVASFFISRIDSAVDAAILAKLKTSTNPEVQKKLNGLLGNVAIANAKLAYQFYKELFGEAHWKKLADQGARTQRLLWASTGSKNPAYRDVRYIEELIGQDTVNTVPPATYDAFRDHGQVRASLDENVDAARTTLSALERAGISLDEITGKLLEDGVQLFSKAFDELLAAIDAKRQSPASAMVQKMKHRLPEALAAEVMASLADWCREKKMLRLWARDTSLWTGGDEAKWLGWLGITEDQINHCQRLREVAELARNGGFSHALLLGMGGSSLCPEVLKITFGKVNGFPELHVLDSTDPAQVLAIGEKIDLTKTLFIVSSKSGSTLEPNIFKAYFFERVKQLLGAEKAGERFIAITDPGSAMQRVAENDKFGRIFFGVPSIGGRYSALSNFGLVPAAVMGLDVQKFLNQTEKMVQACASAVPADLNPGAVLGNILGVLAKNGRDKLTLITSPPISDLGAWLEQLIAESTGKQGKGIIPIDREELGVPSVYGSDRIFVYLRNENGADSTQDAKVDALEKAGQPVVRIPVADIYDIGQEFFRWEIATAVAGSILGINPFDQPDVEASKIATRELTNAYEKTGSFPPETPLLSEDNIHLFTDDRNAELLRKKTGTDQSLVGYLKAHLSQLGAGDYLALLAYIHMNAANETQLQTMRHLVRDQKKVATCLGFGPRFLHSTGQAYKGGPNSGVFLQITCEDANDVRVPGQKYTFSVVKSAQARGDFQVLSDRKRRALRVHLGNDVPAGLTKLNAAIRATLK